GIAWIRPVGLHRVPEDLSTFFEESLRRYVRVPKSARKKPQAPLYELAVLVNPNEVLRPSNDIALQRLARAGRDDRVDVEFLTARDLQRVPEFDALFIRETTALYHHTFRFARKAELEGIPVIDDTRSIVRCTNKVFLAEALKANGIPAPRTVFLDRASFDAQRIARMEDALGYPMVLKIPDGSFSRGVERADN
ncbi:MAG: RimK family alpha-L-glutamate ligase, partial [Xanthomonadales bacterium]|nr:RimK family alpha-L-glutamate ligase [Xanthomonadales bacterium]